MLWEAAVVSQRDGVSLSDVYPGGFRGGCMSVGVGHMRGVRRGYRRYVGCVLKVVYTTVQVRTCVLGCPV